MWTKVISRKVGVGLKWRWELSKRRLGWRIGGRFLLFMLVNFQLLHIEILYFRAQPLKFFASNGKVSSQSLFSQLVLQYI